MNHCRLCVSIVLIGLFTLADHGLAYHAERSTLERCERYAAYFNEAASTYGIPSNLLRAIAVEESRCLQSARNPEDGGCGIMQLTGPTRTNAEAALNVDEGAVCDDSDEGARLNILGGALVLSQLRCWASPRVMDQATLGDCQQFPDKYFPPEKQCALKEAIELWWWPLVQFNGGGADNFLTTSNYPYRVWDVLTDDAFIDVFTPGGGSFSYPPLEMVAYLADGDPLPTDPSKNVSFARHEVREADDRLYPTPSDLGEPDQRGGIRWTLGDFDPFRDVVLHRNDGSEFHGCSVEARRKVRLVLIIDSSGSMRWNDPANKRLDAARAYLAASLPGDFVGIVDFDHRARVASALQELPGAREDLNAALETIDSNGGTNIGAAIRAACEALQEARGAGIRGAILLTDGRGGFSDEDQCFKERGWPIYTFGLGSADDALLAQIAWNTGAEYARLPASGLVCEFQRVRSKLAGVENPRECRSFRLRPLERYRFFVEIETGQLQATFSSSWVGSEIVMTLVTPSGRVIDREQGGPDVTYQRGSSSETFSVVNPEAGEWQIEVFAADVPPDGEDVTISITSVPAGSAAGDIDGDGDVDLEDIVELSRYRSQASALCPECDVDRDGWITVLDMRKAVLLCSRPRCATE